jgi:hypothetical protein
VTVSSPPPFRITMKFGHIPDPLKGFLSIAAHKLWNAFLPVTYRG